MCTLKVAQCQCCLCVCVVHVLSPSSEPLGQQPLCSDRFGHARQRIAGNCGQRQKKEKTTTADYGWKMVEKTREREIGTRRHNVAVRRQI